MTRILDILIAIVGLVLCFPFQVVFMVLIAIESPGNPIYVQTRIGKHKQPFGLLKLRSMRVGADKGSKLTVGKDSRVTRVGSLLRAFKLDELPQLWNVLKGDMSMVGPRPEVAGYVDLYTKEQLAVLSVRPGLTDYASIEFSDESELLQKASDPEKYYIEEIMPRKIQLNMIYIENPSVGNYIKVLLRTALKVIRL